MGICELESCAKGFVGSAAALLAFVMLICGLAVSFLGCGEVTGFCEMA